MLTSLAILLLAGATQMADATARPRYYQARLVAGIGSESPPGLRFEARLVGPLSRSTGGALPGGTVLQGSIRRSLPVGLGLRRERALLEISFDGCRLPSGETIHCGAELVEVDNARETMLRPNVLRGILAASHPHSWADGVWFRPSPLLFGKSVVGLTGAAGMAHARLVPNPVAGAALVGARVALLRLPEPEIRLPAGTDLVVRITHPPSAVEPPADGAVPTGLPPEWAETLRDLPAAVSFPNRTRAADLINFAFAAGDQSLESAFAAAGWTRADPLTTRTFTRTYAAFASMNSYDAAPVSPLLYQGRTPDLVFQRTFNSIAKRHHIRLWRTELDGETVWLGAATHDVAIAFDWNRLQITHRIDRHIDRERNVIVNHLLDAGCVARFDTVERPELREQPQPSRPRVTDGALVFLRLQPCEAPAPSDRRMARRHPLPRAAARRVVLETRHYVLRSNPYYLAYRAVRRR